MAVSVRQFIGGILGSGSGTGVTAYTTIAQLPLAGNDSGSMAFVEQNNRLYIWTGVGWFNIALINTNPTISQGPDSNYVLALDGTPIAITLAAEDPEGIPIVFSAQVTSGTLGNTAVITQDANVFTITPSTDSADGGVFGVTFTASDGVNIATAVSSFELNFTPPPTVIGQEYGGGFYAGQISTTGDGVATHYLIVSPKASGQIQGYWKTTNTLTAGVFTNIDGPTNTANMLAGGENLHPLAKLANDAVIDGYDDWYIPSKNELEILFFNLKPFGFGNVTSSGANPNAVPPRGNYTSTVPGQTSVAAFQDGGAQSIAPVGGGSMWTSTQSPGNPDTHADVQSFGNGDQGIAFKANNFNFTRLVRRVPV